MLIQDSDDDTVVLAVTDGVGSRPCDWRASEVACAAGWDRRGLRPAYWARRDRNRQAHWTLDRETGRCEGMLATIVVAACPRDTTGWSLRALGTPASTGIYPDRVAQVMEDNVQTKTICQDTRISLPVVPPTYRRDFLTQALGGEYELDLDVQRASFPPGAGVALASDGAYPLGEFDPKLRRIFERPDLEGSLSGWFEPSGLCNEDDATLALLRRSGLPEETRQNCRHLLAESVDCRSEGTAPYLMAWVLLKELDRALENGEENRVTECARYMRRFSVTPGQEVLADLLDRIAEHPTFGKDTFERVLRLARQGR